MSDQGPGRGREPTAADRALAGDQHTFPGLLADLVNEVPALWPVLAANPSTPYAELKIMQAGGGPAVQAALATNSVAVALGVVAAPAALPPPAAMTATVVTAVTTSSTARTGKTVVTAAAGGPQRARLKGLFALIGLLVVVAFVITFLLVRNVGGGGHTAPTTTSIALPPSSAARPPSTETTTTTVAATTATLPPTTLPPTTTTTPPTPEQLALALAQEVSTALADGKWSDVRAFIPDNQLGDAEFETLFPFLDHSTVVLVTSTAISPGRYNLRLGLVDNETPPTGAQTTLRCAHWDVNIGNHTVRRIDTKPLRVDPGTETAAALIDQLRPACLAMTLA